jgi:hypothetical protein
MLAPIWLNVSGIILQIVGFILLLLAVKQMPFKGGSFTSGVDYLGNVMSTRHPKVNVVGISLVILGLVLQLVVLFVA